MEDDMATSPNTTEELRALIIARTYSEDYFMVTARPTVGDDTYELHFHLDWWKTMRCYRAIPLGQKDGEWFHGAVVLDPEVELLFRLYLLQVYGVEHVFFDLDSEQASAVQKVLGLTTVLPR
jgi:hypothetical protein